MGTANATKDLKIGPSVKQTCLFLILFPLSSRESSHVLYFHINACMFCLHVHHKMDFIHPSYHTPHCFSIIFPSQIILTQRPQVPTINNTR